MRISSFSISAGAAGLQDFDGEVEAVFGGERGGAGHRIGELREDAAVNHILRRAVHARSREAGRDLVVAGAVLLVGGEVADFAGHQRELADQQRILADDAEVADRAFVADRGDDARGVEAVLFVIHREQPEADRVAGREAHRDLFDDRIGLRTVGRDGPFAGEAHAVVADVGILAQIGFKAGARQDRNLIVDEHRFAVRERTRRDAVHGGGLALRGHADGDDSTEIHNNGPSCLEYSITVSL